MFEVRKGFYLVSLVESLWYRLVGEYMEIKKKIVEMTIKSPRNIS